METTTFEQFKNEVGDNWKGASEKGEFRDFSPAFKNSKYDKDRKYYTWQNLEGSGCAAYDTNVSVEEGRSKGKRWMADAGRGMHGWGDTLKEAFADEDAHYDV